MHIRVSLDDGVPIHRQIVNQVKYLAAAGRLAAGERLPPVRKLAEQLLVNPNTVARAYRELEAAGVIVTQRGSGVFVAENAAEVDSYVRSQALNERIDRLLTEARLMDISLDEVINHIHERNKYLNGKDNNHE